MLHARNISVELEAGFRPFSDVSLSLKEGSITVLSGLNGSGKTQLLRCLCGLSSPASGSITIDGRDVSSVPAQRMQAVRMVFQHADRQMLSYTVGEEIAFGPRNLGLPEAEVRRRCEDALVRFGLEDREEHHPSTLSGGELRRLAVASIFVMQPRFLLLDEPFSNLDYPALRALLRAILDLRAHGVGIVVAGHELDKILAHADVLWLMQDGRLRYQGDPEHGLETARELGLYVPPLSISAMSRLAGAEGA